MSLKDNNNDNDTDNTNASSSFERSDMEPMWTDLRMRDVVSRCVQPIYDTILRPLLPRRVAVFNGVAVRDTRLLDATQTFPDCEGPLVAAIQQRVSRGDSVVVVGGGRGVSSVTAAHRTGPTGSVTAYEGSATRHELASETVGLNNVESVVDVEHAIVGPAVKLYDPAEGAARVDPGDLPECDVLVIDCEGAEIGILESLDLRPRALIVETHAFLGSPENEVRAALDEIGYDVVDRVVEFEEKGVHVLTAVETN